MSSIFTDLVMHNYQSNQSAFMTRCRTDLRHYYGILGGKSHICPSCETPLGQGAKKDGCFHRLCNFKDDTCTFRLTYFPK